MSRIGSPTSGSSAPVFDVGAVMSIPADPLDPARQAMRVRLGELMNVLSSEGHNDLQALGQMQVGGSCTVTRGLLTPPILQLDATAAAGGAVAGRGAIAARKVLPAKSWQDVSAGIMRKTGATVITWNAAFWAADSITLPDDTNLELDDGEMSLIILVRRLVLGQNVSITYERQPVPVVIKPPKPAAPYGGASPSPATPGRDGTPGASGVRGTDGANQTNRPKPAPRIEIWALEVVGSLRCDLRGQDGFPAQEGGDGADGQPGGKGGDAQSWGGPGAMNGGNGGAGGNGGDGGRGGDGAAGGELVLYSTPQTLSAVGTAGFSVLLTGGAAGPGGRGGKPGQGGSGGQPGTRLPLKLGDAAEYPGSPGATGQPGRDGQAGLPGSPASGTPVRFLPISQDDFAAQLLLPRISNVTNTQPPIPAAKNSAYVGQQCQVAGENFSSTDRLVILNEDGSDIPCTSSFVSSNLMTFTVPAAPCGARRLFAIQNDGTRGVPGTILVCPKIDGSMKGKRLRPGEVVGITGTGLSKNCTVTVRLFRDDGTFVAERQLDPGSVVSASPTAMNVKIARPTTAAQLNPSGEKAKVIIRAQGFFDCSAEVDVILDTYLVVAAGDSIMFNVGLPDLMKHHAAVESSLRTRHSGIGVYRTVYAHTGAIIGSGLSEPQMFNGELPTDYPTIFQQIDRAATEINAGEVDLVLLNGGINDMGLSNIIATRQHADALTKKDLLQKQIDQIRADIEQYCHVDMKKLLLHAAAKFPKAKFVVIGYNYFISLRSRSGGITEGGWWQMWAGGIGFKVPGTWFKECTFELVPAAEKCRIFVNESAQTLDRTVSEVNAALGGTPRCAFANPLKRPDFPEGFTDAHAIYADTPGLFQLNGIALNPEDPMATERARLVDEAGPSYKENKAYAKRASTGHPNVLGTSIYAAAINAELTKRGW